MVVLYFPQKLTHCTPVQVYNAIVTRPYLTSRKKLLRVWSLYFVARRIIKHKVMITHARFFLWLISSSIGKGNSCHHPSKHATHTNRIMWLRRAIAYRAHDKDWTWRACFPFAKSIMLLVIYLFFVHSKVYVHPYTVHMRISQRLFITIYCYVALYEMCWCGAVRLSIEVRNWHYIEAGCSGVSMYLTQYK